MLNKINTPRNILFYGMSGAGKGTQSRLLFDRLKKDGDTNFMEIGNELRNYVADNDTLGAEFIKNTIDNGNLLPAAVPVYIWSDILLNKIKKDSDLIIDGAARSINEAKLFSNIMKWLNRDVTIFVLEIDAKTAINRAVERGEGRADDTEEGMRHRLEWFKNDTMPAIDFMMEEGSDVYIIDGSKNIEEVKTEIWSKLGLA